MTSMKLIVLALLAALSQSAAAQIATEVIDIGTLGGTYSRLVAISPSGEWACGESTTANGETHAVRYHVPTNSLLDLGSYNGTNTTALGVNDSGMVLAHVTTGSGASARNRAARITEPGAYALLPLPTNSFHPDESYARAINREGDVIGRWFPDYGPNLGRGDGTACIWLNGGGRVDQIGAWAGGGDGWAISNRVPVGEPTASAWCVSARNYAGITTYVAKANGPMPGTGFRFPGPFGGYYAIITDVNEAGDMIGYPETRSSGIYRFRDGSLVDLGSGYIQTMAENGEIILGGKIVRLDWLSALPLFPVNRTYANVTSGSLNGYYVFDVRDISDNFLLAGAARAMQPGTPTHGVIVRYQPCGSLGVNSPPTITMQPQIDMPWGSLCPNQQFEVRISAVSPGAIVTYQWRKNGAAIDINTNPSAATPTLLVSSGNRGTSSSYNCIVSNGCYTATSQSVTASVASLPLISGQPQSVSGCSDSVFSVIAAGAGPLVYEWQIQSFEQSGATWKPLNEGSVTLTCPGGSSGLATATSLSPSSISINVGGCAATPGRTWPIRCIVSDACGSTTSSSATLTIVAPCGPQDQCPASWQPFDLGTASYPGVNGGVHASTTWDPDGPGPMPPQLVVAGSFTLAGNTLANNIAAYDPATARWAPLGNGVEGYVYALTSLPNGELVAAGDFTMAGEVPVNSIAHWNGSEWLPLGQGLGSDTAGYPASASTLTTLPNGDLVVGGAFTSAGGVAARSIARWNGTTWFPLGTGLTNGDFSAVASVYTLKMLPNGDLIAGGNFTTAGGSTANSIARWDGSAWSPLGDGVQGEVYSLLSLPNGAVIAAGAFFAVGAIAVNNVAAYDTATGQWTSLGDGLSSYYGVFALTRLASGDILAGGAFSGDDLQSDFWIARWNGLTWTAADNGVHGDVRTFAALPNGDLFAGGYFGTDDGAGSVARLSGLVWSGLTQTGINGSVLALLPLPNGDLIAGGYFTTVGGVMANAIARWNGSEWTPLSSGMNRAIEKLASLPNGDIIAAGDFFTTDGGVAAYHLARWNGSVWSPLGLELSSTSSYDVGVSALLSLPNGDLIVGGFFTSAGASVVNNITRWNGSEWSPLGTGMGGYLASVSALTTLANGDLIVGGSFSTAGGVAASNIARWNGSEWVPLGAGLRNRAGFPAAVSTLATLPNGDIIAGGLFDRAGAVTVNGVARWNGSTWSGLGAGLGFVGGDNAVINALTVLPNGDLIAGGYFLTADGLAANYIARWNGSAWSPLSTGMSDPVEALTSLASGEIIAGGGFITAGGTVAPFIARYTAGSIATEPVPQTACSGGSATLVVAMAGTGPYAYQWRKDGEPIDALANLSAATDSLVLSSVTSADAGYYDCVITTPCGSMTSIAANLTICIGDFNCDGGVDGADIDAFFTDWELGSPIADTNADGGVDGADVSVFFERWEAGC